MSRVTLPSRLVRLSSTYRLIPTAAHLADYTARANRQRNLAFLSAGVGAAFVAGGVGFLVWNQGKKDQAEARFDAYADEVDAMPPGSCDGTCEKSLGILVGDLDDKRKRDVFGWIGVAVGGAALGTGAFLYFNGEDPHHYEPKSQGSPLAAVDVRVGLGNVELRGFFRAW
ncbi:MAG: hypothetical protein QM756_16730 [Polyangiaceae bacterium]